jgi:adenylosuccinate synthase
VIRWNGGSQAAHNVVTNEGQHHTFAQWGSGTFAGAQTLLGPDVLVNPWNANNEAQHLNTLKLEPWVKLAVSADCRIITPYHQVANQRAERARGSNAHGSTGQGIGETVADSLRCDDVLRMRDLRDFKTTLQKLEETQRRYGDVTIGWENSVLARSYGTFAEKTFIVNELGPYIDAVTQGGPVVYEGAQGVLLDESYGFHPHTTWSDCTFAGAEKIHAFRDDELVKIGLTRAYHTRHGYGPFPTDGTGAFPEDYHNKDGEYMGAWRTGALDLILLEYATRAANPDCIGVTCLDRVPRFNIPVCEQWIKGPRARMRTLSPRKLPESIGAQEALTTHLNQVRPVIDTVADRASLIRNVERVTGRRVVLEGWGPKPADKLWRA